MLNLVKVAVTGAPSSGKSTVCRILKELGAYVVSADDIVHQLLSSQIEIIKEVTKLLGEDIVVAGQLDRKIIAKIVFNNHRLLLEIEKILHPAVLKKIEVYYQKVSDKNKYSLFVVELPLLYEGHFEDAFDKIILVTAKEESCINRFLKKEQHTKEEYRKRKERFISDEEKMNQADFVVKNDGSLQELEKHILAIYKSLTPH